MIRKVNLPEPIEYLIRQIAEEKDPLRSEYFLRLKEMRDEVSSIIKQLEK